MIDTPSPSPQPYNPGQPSGQLPPAPPPTPAQPSAYVPGICNINQEEVATRRKTGYFGLAVFIALLGMLMMLSLNRWFRIILVVPAFIAAIGFLQARNKFCVGYGGHGLENAAEGSNEASKVSDPLDAKKDKDRAAALNRQAAIIAVIVTLIMMLLPE